jgi:hypothetical protein
MSRKFCKRNAAKRRRENKYGWCETTDGLTAQKTQKTIEQGELLFNKLNATIFSTAHPNIDGMVAMTYALSKTYVAVKMALKEFGIELDPYFENMVRFFEPIMKREVN